ncbi:MAG: hypothetical protein DCC68_13920 [Planctomycetota bacterium]|nr:MAG: hypothetical protein DCC68_13920 [Planctomycetota bacterium]
MVARGEFLERLVSPLADCFTPDVARRVAALRADPRLQARIDELADKCNEGELTAEERDEYELYVHTGEVIALLQAKARSLTNA